MNVVLYWILSNHPLQDRPAKAFRVHIKSQLNLFVTKLPFCAFSLYFTLMASSLVLISPTLTFLFVFSLFYAQMSLWKQNGTCRIVQIIHAFGSMASLRWVKSSEELVWVFLPCFYYCYYFFVASLQIKRDRMN